MNNTISIIMPGLVLSVCISFLLKVRRDPEPDKENQTWVTTGVAGSAVDFVVGLILGAIVFLLVFGTLRKKKAQQANVFRLFFNSSFKIEDIFIPSASDQVPRLAIMTIRLFSRERVYLIGHVLK